MICAADTKNQKNSNNRYPTGIEGYEIEIYHSIEQFEERWTRYEDREDIFLSIKYFKAVEACPPDDMTPRYILLYRGEECIALFPIQLKQFEGQDSIKDVTEQPKTTVESLRNSLVKRVRFNTLIAGNIMVSGEYMYCFLEEGHSPKERFEWLELILDAYRDILESEGTQVSMCFTKDVPDKRSLKNISIEDSKFREFSVEPLMVLHLRQEWNCFDDYLQAMHSKYRVRARRAFKKGSELRIREAKLEEIESRVEEYYPLYLEVYKNLNFSLFKLDRSYFATMKRFLGADFRFYFVENQRGEIKAFFSLINNRRELHAHFLGYDKEANAEFQIYLNLLYKMIEIGIEEKFKLVDFGRTALEIKSSVGAIPHHYSLYIKHKNAIANLFVSPLINILNKKTEWVSRHPFKET